MEFTEAYLGLKTSDYRTPSSKLNSLPSFTKNHSDNIKI